jgi:hypothetical protein
VARKNRPNASFNFVEQSIFVPPPTVRREYIFPFWMHHICDPVHGPPRQSTSPFSRRAHASEAFVQIPYAEAVRFPDFVARLNKTHFRMLACESGSYSDATTLGAILHASMQELFVFADMTFWCYLACQHARMGLICKHDIWRYLACRHAELILAGRHARMARNLLAFYCIPTHRGFNGPLSDYWSNAPN